MAKTGQRIRKHQMKEDSFVTFAFRAQEFIQTHQKPLLIALAAVAVVIAGALYVSSAGKRAEFGAEQLLAQAFGRVQQNDLQGAAVSYRAVIDEYGGTAAAREALYYLANLYFVQENWAEAITAYQRYIDRYAGFDGGRTAAAWSAIGDARQSLGEHSEALTCYDRALRIAGARYLAGEILLSAARSALAEGDGELATAYADSLFNRLGNSPDMTSMRELLAGHGIRYTRGF
jgi:tetratricopeptide (TPR) repeat protein